MGLDLFHGCGPITCLQTFQILQTLIGANTRGPLHQQNLCGFYSTVTFFTCTGEPSTTESFPANSYSTNFYSASFYTTNFYSAGFYSAFSFCCDLFALKFEYPHHQFYFTVAFLLLHLRSPHHLMSNFILHFYSTVIFLYSHLMAPITIHNAYKYSEPSLESIPGVPPPTTKINFLALFRKIPPPPIKPLSWAWPKLNCFGNSTESPKMSITKTLSHVRC